LLQRWLDERDLVARVQFVGIAILALGYAASWVGLPSLIAGLAFAFGAVFMMIAFALWAWPIVCSLWRNSFGKLVFVVLNLAVIWVATLLASATAADALGLPPTFFPMTTSFLAFMYYLPAALLVGYFLFALLSLVLEVIAMIRDRDLMKYLGLMLGSIFLSIACAMVAQVVAHNEASVLPVAREIAYFADFHVSPLYPGVEAEEHIVVLDSGRIAVAVRDGSDVLISVRVIASE